MRLIERYYPDPPRLSEPVANDLDPWRVRGGRAAGAARGWDDGLYTGESVLHIAIVQVPRRRSQQCEFAVAPSSVNSPSLPAV